MKSLLKDAKKELTGGLRSTGSGSALRELYSKSKKVQPDPKRYTATCLQAIESLRTVDEEDED
jgi:hypothetical protein